MSILRDPLIITPRGNIGDDVANPEAVQRNFEGIDALFPLRAQNIANDVPKLPANGVFVVDGPHDIVVPAIAGGATSAVPLTTTRTGWSNAGVSGGLIGTFLLWDFAYVNGANWTVTFANPWGFAQPAGTFRGFVMGA